MLYIHSNQPVYLEKPELILPERKGNRGPKLKRLTVTDQSVKVSEYIKGLDREDWEEIKVRKTTKGTLKGLYHFAKVYIWNKQENQIEKRILVIRRLKTKSGEEIKYSFTNADLIQYTGKNIGIDHFKPILIDQLKTLVFWILHKIPYSG